MLRLDPFLEAPDADRVLTVLRRLNDCGLDYAVTGGMALESSLGLELGRRRPFNDIDLVVSGFDSLPSTLASRFLISHSHPKRPTGKLAIQLVEPEQRVRIDVFSACGATMERARLATIGDLSIRTVAVEDLACRIASEMMCFSRGDSVPPKCADDHARARRIVDKNLVEQAWQDHRREIDPPSYAEAVEQIGEALERRTGGLVKSVYSTDTETVCPHCHDSDSLRVTPSKVILSVLGYC
ncbi:hypothetical protein [Rhizobium sp. YK2]|uniref:hypothetical protein n=1 Tax=Rhizobium sp. YK2 TaxID=1860096 RepID=UPI00084BF452|nr:hypothetical protein [Rhizobium sp. YK2]OEC93591.1 hypothetical protein A9Z06_09185 [Rhizobium sp. YK2]